MDEKFKFKPLKVLREQHNDENNLIRLWVVQWGSGTPVLEKRRVWIDKDGTEKPRKMVGLDTDDLNYIVEHQYEIANILQGEVQQ
jgi:hypothetical protein